MGHVVHIRSKEQFKQAIRVLDQVPGTWQAIGTSARPVLLLTEAQFQALVVAAIVPANDSEVKARGKKPASKKAKS